MELQGIPAFVQALTGHLLKLYSGIFLKSQRV